MLRYMFIAPVVTTLISTQDFVSVKIFSVYIPVFAIPFAENSEVASKLHPLSMDWMIRGFKPGGALKTNQPPVQAVPCHSLGAKRPGRGVNHPPPSSAEVNEGVELYLYSRCVPLLPLLRVKFNILPFFNISISTFTLAL
jgi:hypothetical protein